MLTSPINYKTIIDDYCSQENFANQNRLAILKIKQTIDLMGVKIEDKTIAFRIATNGIIFISMTQDLYLNPFF